MGNELTKQNKERKAISKSELALLYFPDSSLHTALRLFREWVNDDPALQKALKKTGYPKRRHLLTPRQLQIISKFLGPP